jgi:hypothetical protein
MKQLFRSMVFGGAVLCAFATVAEETSAVTAGDVSAAITAPNQATISDGRGVELTFDGDGAMVSIKSTASHAVDIANARGIEKAYIIAEEKAKAAILRFKDQFSANSTVVTQIDDSLNMVTQSKGTAGAVWSEQNTQNVSESVKQIMSSSSSGMLSGVIMLHQEFNKDEGKVIVVIGQNRTTAAAAQQLKNGFPTGAAATGGAVQNPGEYPSKPSEQHTNPMMKDFDKP